MTQLDRIEQKVDALAKAMTLVISALQMEAESEPEFTDLSTLSAPGAKLPRDDPAAGTIRTL